MNYKDSMLAGYEAMLQAANEENKSHSSVFTLGQAMHDYWDLAAEHFQNAAQSIPTANVEWATATEMRLLALGMKERYKIPKS